MLASRLLIPLKASYKSYFLLPMSRRNFELLNNVHLFNILYQHSKQNYLVKFKGKQFFFCILILNSISAFTLMKQQNKKDQKVNIFIR